MHEQPDAPYFAESASPLPIHLEIDSDDPALTGLVGREVVHTLQQEGYPFEQLHTGQRGGELNLIVELGVQAALFLQRHHALIAEGIQDLSGLVAISAGVVALCQKVVGAVEKRVHEGGSAEPASVTITVEIDGHPVSVASPDLKQAEAALELARRFSAAHPVPARQATPAKSTVKVKAQVKRPPQQKPGRHR